MDPATARALSLAEAANPKSVPLLTKAVELCERSGGTANIYYAHALRGLSEALCVLDQFAESLRNADKSLAVLAALDQADVGVLSESAAAWTAKGLVLPMVGRSAEALLAHQNVLRLCELTANDSGLICALTNIACQQKDGGRFKESLSNFRLAETRALAAPRGQIVHAAALARIARSAAIALSGLRRWDEALASARLGKARRIQLSGKRSAEAALCCQDVSTMLLGMGDLNGAMEELCETEFFFAQNGWEDPRGAEVLMHLGGVAIERGRHQDALEYLERSLTILRIFHPPDHSNFAFVRRKISRAQTALGLSHEAVASLAAATHVIRRSQLHCAGPNCELRQRPDGAPLDQCAGCLRTYYCSVACQSADWKRKGGHKEECKALAAERRAASVGASSPSSS